MATRATCAEPETGTNNGYVVSVWGQQMTAGSDRCLFRVSVSVPAPFWSAIVHTLLRSVQLQLINHEAKGLARAVGGGEGFVGEHADAAPGRGDMPQPAALSINRDHLRPA
jgi:hypothetical protein